jgi:AcrR family transcriptional regulator
MSTAHALPYEQHGRTAQKQRTRQALIAAARDLLAHGRTPTIEATADAAAVSRTTAYRYFPSQRALLVATHPEIEVSSLLPPDPPTDPEIRLELAVRGVLGIVLDSEVEQRATLRLSLDEAPHDAHELPLRQGRVIAWLSDALEPVRATLGDADFQRLVLGIRTTIGIEALVWLVDVAGLSREEAAEQMRWAAFAVYRAAIASAGGPPATAQSAEATPIGQLTPVPPSPQ